MGWGLHLQHVTDLSGKETMVRVTGTFLIGRKHVVYGILIYGCVTPLQFAFPGLPVLSHFLNLQAA